jgi:GNAT superfamily N-acetyltransferase
MPSASDLLTVDIEPYAGEEMDVLYRRNHHEVNEFRDICNDQLDHQQYRDAEKRGRLVCVYARVDRDIVGYFIVFVRPHQHHRGMLAAFEDMYYVAEGLRRKGIGTRMTNLAKAECAKRGAVLMFTTRKLRRLQPHRMLTDAGFRPFEVIYATRL